MPKSEHFPVGHNPKSEIRRVTLPLLGQRAGVRASVIRLLTIVAFCASVFVNLESRAAEAAAPAVTSGIVDTNSQETVRSYLQLQEQLHATQLAIERTRREADEAAAEAAKTTAARLQAIEQALSGQRAQELQAMQNNSRVMLIVAGGFAALGLAAMLFMAYFQWRTVNRLAEISAALPAGHSLIAGGPLPALGDGQTHLLSTGSPEHSNARLLGTIDRLEQRIRELEHTTHHGENETDDHNINGNHVIEASARPSNGEPSPTEAAETAAPSSEADLVSFLLGKGQSLLNLDKPEEALACFDEILTMHQGHPEALVKKGTALEKLRRLNEAIDCYDKAIAADDSMTIAYLCKGGLFNRMERYSEALECYEKALRTQEKRV
jgi:tetratricopeptide (TPR) repeat protein